MADTIKEFLVSLGFKTDKSSQKDFEAALVGTQAKAVALGIAMVEMAKVIAQAMADIIPEFDKLYFQTQRLGSSANDIKAFSYAMDQLGGSAQGANASLKAIADFVRYTPGAGGFLQKLGVDPANIGDAAKTIKDLEASFQNMPAYKARALSQVLGIDPDTLFAMSKDTGEFEAQYRAFAQRMGVNLDDMAGEANAFQTNLRLLKAEGGLAFDVLTEKVLAWLLPALMKLSDWFTNITSGKKLTGMAGQIQDIVGAISDLVHALGQLAVSPYIENFASKMLGAITQTIEVMANLIKLVNDVLSGNWGSAWSDAKAVVSHASQGASSVADAIFGGDTKEYGKNGQVGLPGGPGPASKSPWAGNFDAYISPHSIAAGGGSGTAKPNASGGSSFDTAVSAFMASGLSQAGARGLAAALGAESHGLNPGDINPTSGARGIAQWLTKSRINDIQGHFHKSIMSASLQEQIQMVIWEMKTKFGALWSGLKYAGNDRNAAMNVIAGYEAPGKGFGGDMQRADRILGGKGGVSFHQVNHNTFNGVSDPHSTARAVGGAMDQSNQHIIAATQRFAY